MAHAEVFKDASEELDFYKRLVTGTTGTALLASAKMAGHEQYEEDIRSNTFEIVNAMKNTLRASKAVKPSAWGKRNLDLGLHSPKSTDLLEYGVIEIKWDPSRTFHGVLDIVQDIYRLAAVRNGESIVRCFLAGGLHFDDLRNIDDNLGVLLSDSLTEPKRSISVSDLVCHFSDAAKRTPVQDHIKGRLETELMAWHPLNRYYEHNGYLVSQSWGGVFAWKIEALSDTNSRAC